MKQVFLHACIKTLTHPLIFSVLPPTFSAFYLCYSCDIHCYFGGYFGNINWRSRHGKVLCCNLASVFQIRGGSLVKNPTATTTWPDTDKNDNRLRYSYKSKYYTLCNPPEKLHDPLPKRINWNIVACTKILLYLYF